MNALIIDDSQVMRRILRRVVEPLGFRILEAADGREGLSQLAQHQGTVSLALVNWNMPNMNGLEFVQAVRASDMGHNIKLMMVASEGETLAPVYALMAGVDEFLMKPFSRDLLLEKLRLLGASSSGAPEPSMC